MRHRARPVGPCVLVLASAALTMTLPLVGCGAKGDAKPAAGAPPPQVETAAAAAAPLDVSIGAIGRVSAVDAVMLTPKVGGLVTTLRVEDGAQVAQGTLLVELDTAEAAAALREAQATRDNAKLDLDRSAPLAQGGIVDASRIDALRSALAIADARVAAAQARLDDRRI